MPGVLRPRTIFALQRSTTCPTSGRIARLWWIKGRGRAPSPASSTRGAPADRAPPTLPFRSSGKRSFGRSWHPTPVLPLPRAILRPAVRRSWALAGARSVSTITPGRHTLVRNLSR